MRLLQDKVVLLTGGSAGIGWKCARAYADEGALVAIVSKDADNLSNALQELGGPHIGVHCDISNATEVSAAIDTTLNSFGRIDAIHNNAGIAHPSKPLHETSSEEWDMLMQVNLKGIYHTTRFGFEALKATRGCILNTSSLVGEIGQDNHAAYAASKGAVNALTKSMALDYAPFKVRVNAVAPAGVWTDMLRKWGNEQPDPGSMERYLNNIHALGYCPDGDVVADACVFLASDNARFITGHIMPVSGGAELGYRTVTLQEQVAL